MWAGRREFLRKNEFVLEFCNVFVIFAESLILGKMKYGELVRELKNAGCRLDAPGKKHDRWYSPKTDSFFYVPRHQAKEVPPGTLARLKKEAGI